MVVGMIKEFYEGFLGYFEAKVVALGDFISMSESIVKFSGMCSS